MRRLNVRNRAELSLKDIAKIFNTILRRWANYYGKYTSSALHAVWRHFNKTLVAWVQKKYLRFSRRKIKSSWFVERIMKAQPQLFVHWRIGMKGEFA